MYGGVEVQLRPFNLATACAEWSVTRLGGFSNREGALCIHRAGE